jgi:hypothetical protein
MATGKSFGLKVGDLVYTGAFPAVIMSDVGTSTPCCEVFGFEQECGSAYAHDLKKISVEQFVDLTSRLGHTEPFKVYGKATLSALLAAGLKAEMA